MSLFAEDSEPVEPEKTIHKQLTLLELAVVQAARDLRSHYTANFRVYRGFRERLWTALDALDGVESWRPPGYMEADSKQAVIDRHGWEEVPPLRFPTAADHKRMIESFTEEEPLVGPPPE